MILVSLSAFLLVINIRSYLAPFSRSTPVTEDDRRWWC